MKKPIKIGIVFLFLIATLGLANAVNFANLDTVYNPWTQALDYINDMTDFNGSITVDNLTVDGNLSVEGQFLSPYERVIVVAESGGDFDNIQDACDSFSDSGINTPYLIRILAGNYDVANCLDDPFVKFQCEGEVHISGGSPALNMGNDSIVDGCKISGGNQAIDAHASRNIVIRNCELYGTFDNVVGSGSDNLRIIDTRMSGVVDAWNLAQAKNFFIDGVTMDMTMNTADGACFYFLNSNGTVWNSKCKMTGTGGNGDAEGVRINPTSTSHNVSMYNIEIEVYHNNGRALGIYHDGTGGGHFAMYNGRIFTQSNANDAFDVLNDHGADLYLSAVDYDPSKTSGLIQGDFVIPGKVRRNLTIENNVTADIFKVGDKVCLNASCGAFMNSTDIVLEGGGRICSKC